MLCSGDFPERFSKTVPFPTPSGNMTFLSAGLLHRVDLHCQQVLAGIGFTRDHDFHRYLFAAIELDGLYGTTAALTKQLGRDLIAGRTVPRTIDL